MADITEGLKAQQMLKECLAELEDIERRRRRGLITDEEYRERTLDTLIDLKGNVQLLVDAGLVAVGMADPT